MIVGGGMADTSAAATVATEGNGATCVILEKGESEFGGGNTMYSEGNALYADDADMFLAYMKELRGDFDTTPDDVMEAWAKGCSENLEWVKFLGADESEVYCGGFEDNRETIQDCMHSATAVAPAGVCNTGDGFRMCGKVGASFQIGHANQTGAHRVCSGLGRDVDLVLLFAMRGGMSCRDGMRHAMPPSSGFFCLRSCRARLMRNNGAVFCSLMQESPRRAHGRAAGFRFVPIGRP